jgi:hypothetical protein
MKSSLGVPITCNRLAFPLHACRSCLVPSKRIAVVQHHCSETKAVYAIGERTGWCMAVSAHPQQREGHSAAEPAELWWWARHLGLG